MQGLPTDFWGKLRQDESGAVLEWLPLVDHCCDVAAVAEALLGLDLWRHRLARLAGVEDLDPTTRARLCVLCFLHDLGKLTIPFQAKGRQDLGSTTGGHVEEAVAALGAQELCGCFAPLSDFGDGAFGLLVTALAHHGQPRSIDNAIHQSTRWRAVCGLDPVAGLRRLVASAQSWFPEAFVPGGGLPENPALEHAFAGLVMLADWLASDTTFFPFEAGQSDRLAFGRSRAQLVLRKMGLDVPLSARLDAERREPFARVSAFTPRAAQRMVVGLPEAPRGSVAVLESETGSGKTEAALAHFARLFAAGQVDGLYFALPTKTSATQIHRRVVEAARRAFSVPPAVVLAVPEYLRVDDTEGQKLAEFKVLWPDADRLRFRAWAAENPKRYMVGCIVVGTIDQALLSSLMVRHAHLRATSLLRHLLVVDEVHASDEYMTSILKDVLDRHATAGGHALLLSATLAASVRERLLGAAGVPQTTLASLEHAQATPYPLVTFSEVGSGSARHFPVAFDGRRREISVVQEPEIAEPEAIAYRALDAAANGAKVLVLRNTVADCLATQLGVEGVARGRTGLLFNCRDVVAPHHSRFSRADRAALDEALEVRLGKDRAPGGCVVVATQTVQQSLDIDADLLITDLCPVDVLLQRIGRLHRHERCRPSGFDRPRAVVLVPRERDLGQLLREDGAARGSHGLGGNVYDNLLVLEATWRQIERLPLWRIPDMSRELVERCLHPDAIEALAGELGGEFKEHQMRLMGVAYGRRRAADLNLVDRTKPYSKTFFPTDTDQRISTRLGEGDRLVALGKACSGPFGLSLSELVVPAFWASGVTTDEQPRNLVCSPGALEFAFGERRFTYDRLGLRLQASAGRRSTQEAPNDDGP